MKKQLFSLYKKAFVRIRRVVSPLGGSAKFIRGGSAKRAGWLARNKRVLGNVGTLTAASVVSSLITRYFTQDDSTESIFYGDDNSQMGSVRSDRQREAEEKRKWVASVTEFKDAMFSTSSDPEYPEVAAVELTRDFLHMVYAHPNPSFVAAAASVLRHEFALAELGMGIKERDISVVSSEFHTYEGENLTHEPIEADLAAVLKLVELPLVIKPLS
jgi:hypothetical protein